MRGTTGGKNSPAHPRPRQVLASCPTQDCVLTPPRASHSLRGLASTTFYPPARNASTCDIGTHPHGNPRPRQHCQCGMRDGLRFTPSHRCPERLASLVLRPITPHHRKSSCCRCLHTPSASRHAKKLSNSKLVYGALFAAHWFFFYTRGSLYGLPFSLPFKASIQQIHFITLGKHVFRLSS